MISTVIRIEVSGWDVVFSCVPGWICKRIILRDNLEGEEYYTYSDFPPQTQVCGEVGDWILCGEIFTGGSPV
jgi:hypothetical protein